MNISLFAILMMAFAMVAAKRVTALINGFRAQSLFLFLFMLVLARRADSTELYIVAALLFLIKVILIPRMLHRVVKRIKVSEDLGLSANPTVSIFAAIVLAYLAYAFTGMIAGVPAFFVSISITLIGLFIMIFRMKALAQIAGLLIMENGMFLAAASVSGGMPFIVEIAIFFDVFLAVIILGIFVYKINSLFTHIDVDKLTELKG
ncbi:MAG: hydrogenase [Candidatus Omnitrophota bacterium]